MERSDLTHSYRFYLSNKRALYSGSISVASICSTPGVGVYRPCISCDCNISYIYDKELPCNFKVIVQWS